MGESWRVVRQGDGDSLAWRRRRCEEDVEGRGRVRLGGVLGEMAGGEGGGELLVGGRGVEERVARDLVGAQWGERKGERVLGGGRHLPVHRVDADAPLTIGDDCTVGHGAVIHGATIEDGCLIGMRAVLLNGSRIGAGSIVGSGAVVTEGTVIPPNSLVLGVPAKVVRALDEKQAGRGRPERQHPRTAAPSIGRVGVPPAVGVGGAARRPGRRSGAAPLAHRRPAGAAGGGGTARMAMARIFASMMQSRRRLKAIVHTAAATAATGPGSRHHRSPPPWRKGGEER